MKVSKSMKAIKSSIRFIKLRQICLFSLLYFANSLSIVDANGDYTVGFASNISIQEYFIIFIIGILYLNLFVIGLQKIFRQKRSDSRGSAFFSDFGTLLASLFIATGSLLIISSLLALTAINLQVATFKWLITVILYFTSSLTIGILVLGIIGFLLLLFGIYLILLIQGNPLVHKDGRLKTLSRQFKKERDLRQDLEPLNPSLTFRVFNWDRDNPIIDAKVILKQMNGTKLYSKFTNFNGEVTFNKIDGYGSEYYAYVAGDEKREKYRVLRKKTVDEVI